ncbi:hypothetical protein G6011_11471 [Alternaria panax]|uniref:Uncharacterized protein n=1 Tax=Alternaria panax TaxID=48097 RepID=A0AAD4IDT0_9PLEO|nr:hypothetical protein G6011_11471 [Alternaria panax]
MPHALSSNTALPSTLNAKRRRSEESSASVEEDGQEEEEELPFTETDNKTARSWELAYRDAKLAYLGMKGDKLAFKGQLIKKDAKILEKDAKNSPAQRPGQSKRSIDSSRLSTSATRP